MSVRILLIILLLAGLPIAWVEFNEAFRTILNCSAQLSLAVSPQVITSPARFNPFESNTVSVVDTDSILSNPLAGILRFGV